MALLDFSGFDPETGGILGRQPPSSMSPGFGVGDAISWYLRSLFPSPPRVEGQFPTDASANFPPGLAAPSSPQQQPPSSQPGGVQNSSQIGPPLSLAPPNPGSLAAVPSGGSMGGGGDYAPQPSAQPAITSRDMGLLPGFAGNLQAFGSNLSSGGNLIAGLINAFGGLLTGQRTDAHGIAAQNMVAQYNQLVRSGVEPGKALAMVQNPQMMANFYDPHAVGTMKNAAGEEVPAISYQGQVGPLGGGGFMAGGMDRIREKAAAETAGKNQATVAGSLPNAMNQAQQALALVDSIRNDPELPNVTGVVMGHNPGFTGNQTSLIAKINQLHGQAFLDAWQSLKGAGARITNTEAMRATDAIARMQRNQGTPAFKSALDDFHNVITNVIAANRYIAQGGQGENYTPPQQMNTGQFSQEELTAEARRRGLIQ